MSKSFMSAIRGVVNAVNEGAKDKTADGMTKDAAHFRNDLHKVQDAGFKHMVQKDSETSDYAKMFNGDVEHAKPRLADQQAPEDLNKYVEYNEEAELEEAKKAEKHDEDCECDDCSSEVKEETVSEIYAQPGTPAGAAYNKALQGNAGKPALPLQAGQKMKPISDQGKVAKTTNAYKPPVAPPAASKTKADAIKQGYGAQNKAAIDKSVNLQKGAEARKGTDLNGPSSAPKPVINKSRADAAAPSGTPTWGTQKKGPATEPRDAGVKIVPTSGEPPKSAPTPKTRPSAPAQKPQAAKPQAAKPTAPAAPTQTRQQKRQIERGIAAPGAKGGFGGVTTKQPAKPKAKAPVGTNPLKSSFEIEVNGTSYLVSEAHGAAIAAFVEKYGMVEEGTAGEFISKEMKHPEKLTAKGKKQKIKQALAIYYSKKRRGENP